MTFSNTMCKNLKNKPFSFRLSILLPLCLLGSPLIASPCLGSDFPITVIDDRNHAVTFQQAPKSVASVSVFAADLMSALDLQATGISTLQQREPIYLGKQLNEMVNLGEVHETNMERLTRLDPDLIVGIRQYTEPFAAKFEEVGQFLAYDLVTFDDATHAIETTSAALGLAEQGQQLNQLFNDKLHTYHQQASGNVSVIVLWHWADTIFAFYDHHITPHILTELKANYVMGRTPTPALKKPDSTVISLEKLLRLNPDVILSFTGDDKPISYHPVWQQLKAVKNHRAYRISDQYVMTHGPIARDMVLRETAHLLYPQTFAKPTDIPPAAQAKPLTFTVQ